MNRLLPAALSASILLSPWAAAAPACSKQSPSHTVALLELYTSEGCSSCPPADRFVSSLRASGLGEEQVVPLSLHVDYWDHIGWKDPFTRRSFTERQYWLSARGASRVVYTPEFFIAGGEVRDWRHNVASTVARINAQAPRAQITLNIGQARNGSLPVEVNAKAREGSVYLALYENGLSSDVKAGENRGTLLRHDYVVRDWIGPLVPGDDGKVVLPREFSIPAGASVKNLGVAAFVQDGRGDILQAMALQACAP